MRTRTINFDLQLILQLFLPNHAFVLRAILMTTEYDDTIDTIDDMLRSDRQFVVAGDTGLRQMVETDPRTKVKALAKEVEFYNQGTLSPEMVDRG